MTQRERQLLNWIKENPLISQQELAEKAGITRSSVAVHISNLMKKGCIAGKGYIVRTAPYAAVVGGVNMTASPSQTSMLSSGVQSAVETAFQRRTFQSAPSRRTDTDNSCVCDMGTVYSHRVPAPSFSTVTPWGVSPRRRRDKISSA